MHIPWNGMLLTVIQNQFKVRYSLIDYPELLDSYLNAEVTRGNLLNHIVH